MILNVISPLLPSCWGFSFALRCGVSFFGGIQYFSVDVLFSGVQGTFWPHCNSICLSSHSIFPDVQDSSLQSPGEEIITAGRCCLLWEKCGQVRRWKPLSWWRLDGHEVPRQYTLITQQGEGLRDCLAHRVKSCILADHAPRDWASAHSPDLSTVLRPAGLLSVPGWSSSGHLYQLFFLPRTLPLDLYSEPGCCCL